jgi:hypothetical protein
MRKNIKMWIKNLYKMTINNRVLINSYIILFWLRISVFLSFGESARKIKSETEQQNE